MHSVPLTPEQHSALESKHRDLKRKFVWTSDLENFKLIERWDRPVLDSLGRVRGDCDDWVLEMWHELKDVLPKGSMKFAACRTSRRSARQDHMVLLVFDGEKVWVSDCNYKELQEIRFLGYDQWIVPKDKIDGEWEPLFAG